MDIKSFKSAEMPRDVLFFLEVKGNNHKYYHHYTNIDKNHMTEYLKLNDRLSKNINTVINTLENNNIKITFEEIAEKIWGSYLVQTFCPGAEKVFVVFDVLFIIFAFLGDIVFLDTDYNSKADSTAIVTEVFDDTKIGIQGAVGHEVLVTCPGSINRDLLEPGARVALNQNNLTVVNVFPAKKISNIVRK